MQTMTRVSRVSSQAGERGATLGQELARLRVAAGLSQHDLAKQSGVHRSSIAMLEVAEDPQPGAAILYALSESLGVSTEHWKPYLLPQPPEPPPPPSRGKLK